MNDFYRSKNIKSFQWQFILEILAGARILTRDLLSTKAEHFICWYCFAMFHASWAVSSHTRLLQIEKNISNWSNLMSIHSHLYLKSRLGPEFWPEISVSRSSNLSAGIGLPWCMTPEWFLAIHAFLQFEKLWNWSDFMSIHSHLYLKSGLGPDVDPLSDVERPLQEES